MDRDEEQALLERLVFDESVDLPPVTLAKAWGHLKTITRHHHLVFKHCLACGIGWQGLRHDLSKYSPTEFVVGARFYQGDRSPNAVERDVLGYSTAWLHHKGRNRHHYEYWVDIAEKGDNRLVGKRMPVRYVVEMFCDRVAACKVYKGDAYTCDSALAYYNLEHSAGMPAIHPDSDALLLLMLRHLAEHGERQTFAWIRENIVR